MLAAQQPLENTSSRSATRVLGVLFVLMGVGAIVSVIYWLFTHPALTEGGSPGTITWNLVSTIGVMRPLLLLVAGGLLLWLSRGLFRGYIGAARWAVLVFNWLITGTIAMCVVTPLLIWLNPDIRDSQQAAIAYRETLPYAIAFLVVLILRQVVAFNAGHYRGEEDINDRNTRRAWNLLTPLIIVFLTIAVTPLEQVFIGSLTDERFASSAEVNYVGLENYQELWSVRLDTVPCTTDDSGECVVDEDGNIEYPRLRRFLPSDDPYVTLRYRDYTTFDMFGQHWVISARDIEFLEALVTSVYYTVLAIALQFSIGFFMAMIIAQRTRGIGIMRVVMLVPMAIPTLIASQFWEVMLRSDETGLINAVLLNLGVIQDPQLWLLDPALQVPTLVAVIVWKETPITALLLLPGLLAIPREVYQAAAIDGANRLQRFWRVTIPIMRPTIGVVLVLRTMLFLRVFDLFDILVGDNRFVMATYAHNVLIDRQNLGYASAISVTIFVVTMMFTIAYMRTLRIDEA